MSESVERPSTLWLFNLDAEEELAGSRRYLPARAVRRRVAREGASLLGALARGGDLILSERADGPPGTLELRRVDARSAPERIATGTASAKVDGRGVEPIREALERICLVHPLRPRAWSPTPRARRLLAAVGLPLGGGPDVEVLRRVNSRAFAAAVRSPLAHVSFEKHVADTLEAVLALVSRPSERGWLVRRPFGAAGRGRRRLWAGRPDAGELAWLKAGLKRGPLVVEPFVAITREYTRSGEVRSDGSIVMFGPCAQRTTREGAWTASTALSADEVGNADDAALALAFEEAGRALFAAGYAGPFGIDAFRHRDPHQPRREVLNPLSEINARYTMDWSAARSAGIGSAHSRSPTRCCGAGGAAEGGAGGRGAAEADASEPPPPGPGHGWRPRASRRRPLRRAR